MEKIAKAICSVTARALLETAVVRDSLFSENGKSMIVVHNDAIMSGEMTDEEMYALSAKLVDIDFDANSIIALSFPKLRQKIEEYKAGWYLAIYGQSVPLFRVRISALYPLSDHSVGVVYGTEIRNDHGFYGPNSLPEPWDTWRLNASLRQ